MALIKEKMTDFGVPACYWKVGMITIDTNLEEASFSMNLYINKDSKKSIDTICITDLMEAKDKTLFNKYFKEDRGSTYKDVYTACYEYAKEYVDFFKDAIDDPEEIMSQF